MPAPTKQPQKTALDIRLAESVVFLRAGDATGRHRNMQADAPPGMLRGLLTLTLVKPTRVSSIEIELVGKTYTAWPEGVGARRVEVNEEHEIYAQSYILFRAGSDTPYRNSRRTLSVGPGLALDHDDDDPSDHSSEDTDGRVPQISSGERRGREQRRGPGPPPLTMITAFASRRNLSVDQMNFQRDYVAHRDNGFSPTATIASPPYIPAMDSAPQYRYSPTSLAPAASASHRMHTVGDLNLGHRSEPDAERSSLTSAHLLSPRGRPGGSSASSLRHSSHGHSQAPSARPSFEDERPEFLLGSSHSPLPTPSPTAASLTASTDQRSRHRDRSSDLRDSVDDGRGRKHKFSLANVSNALLDVVMDRVRSHSRSSTDGYVTPPRGRTPGRTTQEEVLHGGEEGTMERDWDHSTLGRMSGVLGLDGRDGEEWGDGWKEFKKGTYTWPISFAIPADSPPTLHCELAHVTWKLKAYAHRPGTFTSKLSASQEITIATGPSEDDIEETDSIIVERQWDTQMQYLITVSGRSFPIGGVMPVSITFMPWTKMRLYRLTVLIEERVDYWTDFKRVARTDPVTRIPLLSLRNPQKDAPPILPLDSPDPQAFLHSPFSDLIPPGADVGEYASSLMGPGPWRIQKDLQLPEACDILHFTNRNRRSNIFVTHMLKIIFRVERGDDQAVDAQTGKRKLFDIVVQTPIHILSCLCNTDNLFLPPYSSPIEIQPRHHTSCNYTRVSGSNTAPGRDPSSHSAYLPMGGRRDVEQIVTPLSSEFRSHHPGQPLPLSRQDSVFQRGIQFERLVAGQESELGEAPPAYEEVVN